ncbi:uncharacterized protein ATC70_007353 [Mucor velutinosus]|uniref:Uncharacterized protein n=1 Tax=Mucor velutinosus TaxID=708070 RepID=A0AAN7D2Q0_9FUNG|nr:hypothetical protein ATC70_007353 [Mucor velutinosus]
MSRSDGAASWRPDCTHWAASNSSRSAVSVARLSLGALRRFWHPEKGTTTSRMGPPLKLPAHLLAIDEDVLISLGAVYSTPWKYPWRCVIDESPV